MKENWKLKATIKAFAQIGDEKVKSTFLGFDDSKSQKIKIEKLEKIENESWINWDHAVGRPVWKYRITIFFNNLSQDEVMSIAWKKLENLVNYLSFFTSAPISVYDYGGLSNVPDFPVSGVEYTSIGFSTETAWEGADKALITDDLLKKYDHFLLANDTNLVGQERINRSIRWLQHSYYSPTPLDEFTALMLAFEAISHLLKTPEKSYYTCRACQKKVEKCPHCEASTEWAGSGNRSMEDYVCNTLNWTKKEWKEVWKHRNNIFHGGVDTSISQQGKISVILPKLEYAVVSALKMVLKLPAGSPPFSSRSRSSLYFLGHGAHLIIKWKQP